LTALTLHRDNPEDAEDIEDAENSGNPYVNWSALQNLFTNDCTSDVLFLLDCCYAGSSTKITSSKSIVEVIAAAGFEQLAPLRGSDSFTTFLTKVLKEARSIGKPIVASVLARRISALLNSTDVSSRGTRVTPQHFPLHNGKSFIEIAPLLPGPSADVSRPANRNSSGLGIGTTEEGRSNYELVGFWEQSDSESDDDPEYDDLEFSDSDPGNINNDDSYPRIHR